MGYFRPYRPAADPASPLLADAVKKQEEYRQRVTLRDDFGALRIIAGVDVGYDLKRELTKAVVVLLDWPSLELRTSAIAYGQTEFPYVPGFLAFREVSTIMKALRCLPAQPDLLMVDGQGVSHPRRMGIAAHLGVESGLPAIGVAKSRLTGRYQEPGITKLSTSPLTDKGETIGTVLRSKEKCNPLFVSAGHKISHETALDITLRCLRGYRLPEPTRVADAISKWVLADEAPVSPMDVPVKKKGLSPETKDLFET